MPIVDIERPQINAPIGAPPDSPRIIVPGFDELTLGSDAPAFLDVMGAGIESQSSVVSWWNTRTHPSNDPDPTFKGFEAIKGTPYEPYADELAEARNDQYLAWMKGNIDKENANRKTLADAPWWQSLIGQGAGAVLDWPTALPGAAIYRGAKGGFIVSDLANVARVGGSAGFATAVQEGALHSTQITRTPQESAQAISGAVLLGGLIGGVGGRILSDAEWKAAVETLDRGAMETAPVPAPASAGAAAVSVPSLEANATAGRVAGALVDKTKALSPGMRVMNSPSAVARDVGSKLFEYTVYVNKNMAGVASEPAAETLTKAWNAPLAAMLKDNRAAYRAYRAEGGMGTRTDFNDLVGHAMRNADFDPGSKTVSDMAAKWRSVLFDPPKDQAIELKMYPKDVSVDTAPSYFTRVYNHAKIVAREGEFRDIIVRYLSDDLPRMMNDFDAETIEVAQKLTGQQLREYDLARRIERADRFDDPDSHFRDIAQEVIDKILGRNTDKFELRPDMTIMERGPLKERTFHIPDALIEDFLESDIEKVARRYIRTMGPDIEITRKFGRADMQEQKQAIIEDYKKLADAAPSEAARQRLNRSMEDDLGDIQAVLDQIRGTSKPEGDWGTISRVARHVQYVMKMGEVLFSSLPDVVRPLMVHGLMEYMQTTGSLITNVKAIKMSVAEARAAGNVLETILAHRLGKLADITDPYSTMGPIESLLSKMSNASSVWNGIRIWTDAMKAFASVMTQNHIIKNALHYGSLNQRERAYMAFLGADESMAGRIAQQFKTYGRKDGHVYIAGTARWDDVAALRTYRAMINKDVDSIIVERGAADIPVLANTPTGKLVLQFKTFALASHQRVLIRGLQEDQKRFIGGMIAMTSIGMMRAYLKAYTGNREAPKFTEAPGYWIAEGLDASGLMAVPMELANAVEKLTTYNPIKSPMRAFDEKSMVSQRITNRNLAGAFLGPTMGTVQDVGTVATVPEQWRQGKDATEGQKNAAERLVPWNSYAGFRQMLRYLINPPERK